MTGTEVKTLIPSVQILYDCIALREKKSSDYQSGVSEIKQADYYPRGVETIYDFMHTKLLRIRSLMAKAKAGQSFENESMRDSVVDLINYATFFVSYMEGTMEGQDARLDMFNKPRPLKASDFINCISTGHVASWDNKR